ncbi:MULTISPECIES: MFS transporter [unclassified Streptomyces]|uniref:MFS transporter n=1 Tax=unclassified Streptomyces TaxID=2593676 RepID=UPI00202ECFC5|nr:MULTISPECIES: MFS transporter [unclassified Streptomyces]MCM1967517.1 MFS transporter [Streptomyces sp. G1]MCX5298140.1 MFS transporter [Streptomyces sp. NBC_00193]
MPTTSTPSAASAPSAAATASAPLMAVTGTTLVLAAAPARQQHPARAARPARAPGPYRRLFALPGTRGFTTGNLIARLPMGMFGISAVMMIAGQRGSYALAGGVVAAGLAATAVVAPWTARLVDRHGQARVAVPATLVAVLGSLSLVACVRTEAPAWTLFASYAATATTPNIGGMSRARWTHLLKGDPAAHHTAMSFEQAADELAFMLGPVVAAFLCTTVFPEAGTLAGAALLLTGMLVFTAHRATEPPAAAPVRGRSPLRALGRLLPLFFVLGTMFGSLEITSVAHLGGHGLGALSGPVIALQAAGSCLAGLLYGTLRPRGLPACLAVLAAAMALPWAAAATGSVPALAAALLAAGMATAPVMVTAMSRIHAVIPPGRLNEGMTLAVTAIFAGIAAGSATAGSAIDRWGTTAPYALPAAAALLALLVGASRAVTRTR